MSDPDKDTRVFSVAKLAAYGRIMRLEQQRDRNSPATKKTEESFDRALERVLATETQPTMFATDQRKGAY